MNDRRQYRTLQKDVDETTLAAIEAIYLDSIPASERKSPEALRAMASRTDYRFHVAEDGGAIVGFGIVYRSAGAGIALLEYFATDAAHRSRGIGGGLLDHIYGEAAGVPVLLEVEAPGGDPLQVRRIGFYRRHGARQVRGFTYRLPLRTGFEPPPPMVILIGGAPELGSLPGDTLKAWVADIYANVYGADPEGPVFRAMFDGAPDEFNLA